MKKSQDGMSQKQRYSRSMCTNMEKYSGLFLLSMFCSGDGDLYDSTCINTPFFFNYHLLYPLYKVLDSCRRVPKAVELLTPYSDFVAHIKNDPGMITSEE